MSLPFDELETLFAAVSSNAFEARYNIAPSQRAPVIRAREAARLMEPLTWGLLPPWAPMRGHSRPMINARSETVAEKPTFRASLATALTRVVLKLAEIAELARVFGARALGWVVFALIARLAHGEPSSF